jgi:hypothetical protein
MVLSWVMAAGFGAWAYATGSRAPVATDAGPSPAGLTLRSLLGTAALVVIALVVALTTSSWPEMVEVLGSVALVAIPVYAARMAMHYALAAADPTSARLRAVFATIGLSVALGIVAGLAVDLLTGGNSMIPATVAYPMVDLVFGMIASVIVAMVCGRKVLQRRQGTA